MAKQTFTTGQVLTAAQMTSLQQTAMGGGSATAKTASYVLVAADAGTVVAMNAAGSTTITVNTSLFSAGDTVFIQNWGAGTCTVTAGTATVTTHGSLALAQYEGGTLYFTSASAAIFFDISQSTGMTNPMTTTGDTIYSSSGSTPARLAIGSTGNVLTVAGGVPTWAAPASGSGLTLIDEIAVSSSSSTNVNNVFSSTYKNYKIVFVGSATGATAAEVLMRLRLSGTDTTSNYQCQNVYATSTTLAARANLFGTDEWYFGDVGNTNQGGILSLDLSSPNLADKTSFVSNMANAGGPKNDFSGGVQTDTTQFTGFTLAYGQTSTGTIFVYGYAKE